MPETAAPADLTYRNAEDPDRLVRRYRIAAN